MIEPNYIRPGKFATNFSNGIIKSLDFDDIFFSVNDGIGEVEHVYLNANNLIEIFSKRKHTVISELGFGTGLNFLLSWRLFDKYNNSGSFDYISIEGYPLDLEILKKVYLKFPNLSKYSNALFKKLPPQWSGMHRLVFNNGKIRLTLIYGEVFEALQFASFKSDIWYLDGFNPKKNPQMWSLKVFEEVYRLTKETGTFSTFSSSGQVRENLSKAGFRVKKIKGFGKKKEMTIGKKPGLSISKQSIKNVIIIGGGIAGASVARALKSRNINITILEKDKLLASGASGNLAAIQSPRIATVNTPSSRLSISGYRFARDLSKELSSSLNDISYMLSVPLREKYRQEKLLLQGWPKDLIRKITDEDWKFIFGHKFPFEGVAHEYGGTIFPVKMIKSMVKDNIEVIYNSHVQEFIKNVNGWKVKLNNGSSYAADALVIACAEGLKRLKQTSTFNLQYTQGQVTYINKQEVKNLPNSNFSFSGYITPIVEDNITVGSTFEKYNISRSDVSENGHRENINKIPESIRSHLFDKLDFNNLKGKVSMRVSAYDRMPMMGTLEKNLFLLSALGSRGMVLGPLLGEALADLICEKPLSIDTEILNACDPHRIERDFLL